MECSQLRLGMQAVPLLIQRINQLRLKPLVTLSRSRLCLIQKRLVLSGCFKSTFLRCIIHVLSINKAMIKELGIDLLYFTLQKHKNKQLLNVKNGLKNYGKNQSLLRLSRRLSGGVLMKCIKTTCRRSQMAIRVIGCARLIDFRLNFAK